MTFFRLLLIAALIAGGVHFWKKHQNKQEQVAVTSPSGFVPVLMPDGAVRNEVLVFAPVNCPKEGAQRARALSASLTDRGIPNTISSNFSIASITPGPDTEAALKRLDVVMRGEVPIVLVNGMGKANPSLEDVVDEVKRAKKR